MRVWEFEDNKTIPSDLVREQDFILRLRRLQRLGTPHLVMNLVLTGLETTLKSRRALEELQKKLEEFSKVTNGFYAEMSNGDIFIIWEETADVTILTSRLMTLLVPEGSAQDVQEKILHSFHLPQDYSSLRERANYYIEVVRLASQTVGTTPAEALKSLPARGPLTAWAVDQIGKLLDDIDLRRYGRTQPIYSLIGEDRWSPIFEEYYISFEDLRRERFAKLEILGNDHLFLALCEMLDQRLLTVLTEQTNTLAGRKINLNLSVSAVMGTCFAQFARSMPAASRRDIGFELNCGDLLQDFSQTLNAIEILHREGFKVVLDNLTPNILGYLNPAAFQVDYIKLNVSKDHADYLQQQPVRQGLMALPLDKLIFYRCDNEKAYQYGKVCGVKHFQGWLIDDLASRKI